MEDLIYGYWLANIEGVGNRTIHQLIKYCGSADNIYHMSSGELLKLYGIEERTVTRIRDSKKNWELEREWDRFLSIGAGFVTLEQTNYPGRLRNIYDPPYGLYYMGRLPEDEIPSVGIVGARECSPYGRKLAKRTGACLGANHVSVISGMARGVDGYGHEGALEGGGRTYAVLGCGVDVIYPPEHGGLYERIVRNGGVLSEYPPGLPPRPGFFPQRNRIISALSDAVLIIEARKKSGSLITADCALEQGKDVYAAPGRVGDPLSEGCNHLIRQGAGILISPEDLLSDLGILSEKNKFVLEKSERLVYSLLDLHPKSIDEISQKAALDIVTTAEILFSMERKGLVRQVWQNHYISVN